MDRLEGMTDPTPLAALNAALVLDTTGYTSIALQVIGTWVGTIAFEQSLDGVNWVAAPGLRGDSVGNQQMLNAITGNAILVFPVQGRLFRARRSVATSGTPTVIAMMRETPVPMADATYIMGAATLPTEFRVTSTASGATTTRVKSAASTNLTLLKNAAGNVFDAILTNNNAADRFFKMYNKASAPLATDIPLFTMLLPAKSVQHIRPQTPIRFATGIGYSITALIADNDATAVAVDDVTGFINWA